MLPGRNSAKEKTPQKNSAVSFLVGKGGFEPPYPKGVGFTVRCDWPLRDFPIFNGAGERIRTPDLLITNQLLYQLSYTSML